MIVLKRSPVGGVWEEEKLDRNKKEFWTSISKDKRALQPSGED